MLDRSPRRSVSKWKPCWRGSVNIGVRQVTTKQMQFHLLSVRTFFKDGPIRVVHSSFFHGRAKRGGVFPSSADYRLAYELDSPLRLHKNVHKIAHVFAPEFELVVSEQLMELLATIPLVKSIESVFEILY